MTFQEFKDTYFAGDDSKALEQLAKESYTGQYAFSKTREGLKEVLNSMDKKTTNIYADYLRDEVNKNPKKINDAWNTAMLCGQVGMDLEEAQRTKKNPFVKEFWLKMLLVLGVIAVYAVLLLLKQWLDIEWEAYSYVVSVIPLVFVSSISYTTATSLLNVFRFRKLKKYIAQNPQVVALEDSAVTQDSPVADTEMGQQEKEQITRTHIFKFLRDYYRNLRAAVLCFGIIFGVMLSIIAVADGVQYPIIAVLLLFLVGLLFVYIRVNKKLKKAESMEFCVVMDKCIHKEVKVDTEDNHRSYHLQFEKYGKHHINHQHTGLLLGALKESALYESVDIGESCYVVLFESENKIRMVLPTKTCCLSAEEFIWNNGVYYPIKTENAGTLISKEVQEQWQDLSERQRMDINESYKCAQKAKAKTRGLVICSVIGVGLTVLGAFLEFVCALNLLIQPLLFAVPMVIALVAVGKSKAAIKKVRMDYADYAELNNMHNAAAGKTLAFLAIDIVAYLLNFFIILAVHL